ncbi:MAG: ABC transporter substrate-binding protein, partial [Acidimicrobiales bacterium]|nr:ABC transporter substrate-binding protein [Acidimicrobiales bacterium]
DYGTGFVRYLEPALTDSGAKVVENVTYEADGTAFDSEVGKVVAAKPDAIVLIGYPEDGGKVLAEMLKQKVDFKKTTIYVTDGLQSNELYKAVDESNPAVTEGIRGTAASAAPENGADFFPDAFRTFAPSVESPIYSAQSYDCVMAIALAAQKTGSDAPFDIAKELTNITRGVKDDAKVCNTAETCLEAAKDGGDINYDGASGKLDFSDVGEPSAGSYDVFTFGADGTYKTDTQVVVGE